MKLSTTGTIFWVRGIDVDTGMTTLQPTNWKGERLPEILQVSFEDMKSDWVAERSGLPRFKLVWPPESEEFNIGTAKSIAMQAVAKISQDLGSHNNPGEMLLIQSRPKVGVYADSSIGKGKLVLVPITDKIVTNKGTMTKFQVTVNLFTSVPTKVSAKPNTQVTFELKAPTQVSTLPTVAAFSVRADTNKKECNAVIKHQKVTIDIELNLRTAEQCKPQRATVMVPYIVNITDLNESDEVVVHLAKQKDTQADDTQTEPPPKKPKVHELKL